MLRSWGRLPNGVLSLELANDAAFSTAKGKFLFYLSCEEREKSENSQRRKRHSPGDLLLAFFSLSFSHCRELVEENELEKRSCVGHISFRYKLEQALKLFKE